jgi:hypothetical protein
MSTNERPVHSSIDAAREAWLQNPFSTEAMVLQARPPSLMARMVSLSICAMAALALVYATWAQMDVCSLRRDG